jgi:Aspartyl protease
MAGLSRLKSMTNWVRLLIVAVLCLALSALAAGRPPDRFSSATSSTTFPVQIREWLVYVPVEISGRKLQFVLDTGSSRTLVDTAQLKLLHLKTRVGDTMQGAGQGRVSVRAIDGLAIRLPGLDLYFDQASAVDLSPVSSTADERKDGLLGFPLLSRYVVTIDYENKTMTVTDPQKFVPAAGGVSLPIEIRHGWPFVAGEVKPSEDVSLQDKFFIDSGSEDAVDHPIASKMETRRPTETGVGLGAPTTGSVARVWGFRLGPYLMRDIAVTCCGTTEDTSRMLGGEILSRFTVTFDYPHQRMFLVPNRRYAGHSN